MCGTGSGSPFRSASATASALRSAAGYASPGGLAPRLREPAASGGQRKCRALFSFAAPDIACAMCGTGSGSPFRSASATASALRSAAGFASPSVSLRGSGSRSPFAFARAASPSACCGALTGSLQASEPSGFLGGRRTRRAVSPFFVLLVIIKCLTFFCRDAQIGRLYGQK